MPRLIAGFFAILLGLVACTSESNFLTQDEFPVKSKATETFHKFVDEFYESTFRYSPSYATATGIHSYDDRIEDLTEGAIEKRTRELKSFTGQLAAIPILELSFDDSIDARALSAQIQSELFEIEVIKSWQKNPMHYAGLPGQAIDTLIKREFAPARERLRAVIARLNGIPKIYEAGRANLQNPPKEFTDLAIRMADGSVEFFDKNLAIWADSAAGQDKKLLDEFKEANKKAKASAQSFDLWLRKDLLPRSHGIFSIGPESFLNLMKYQEMIEQSLPDLLATGEKQLARDYADLIATAKQIDPHKTPAEVMHMLSDEHPDASDLLPSVRRTLEESRRFLIDHQIISIPTEVRPRVAETPLYDRSGSFASMDTPGPEEQIATESFYYVTPVEKNWSKKHKEEHLRAYNPYVVSILNIHEAFPGHFIQFVYARQLPSKVRKLAGANTNIEGWAHYTEQMMVEQGFGHSNPKYRLAQLEEALLRDCRYIVGIKLHTEAWTVEKGAAFFEKNAFQEPANAYEESRRGAYNPTYLYYTLGKIEIQKLRDDYLAQKKGDVKGFHDAFIKAGALPLPLIREILLRTN